MKTQVFLSLMLLLCAVGCAMPAEEDIDRNYAHIEKLAELEAELVAAKAKYEAGELEDAEFKSTFENTLNTILTVKEDVKSQGEKVGYKAVALSTAAGFVLRGIPSKGPLNPMLWWNLLTVLFGLIKKTKNKAM